MLGRENSMDRALEQCCACGGKQSRKGCTLLGAPHFPGRCRITQPMGGSAVGTVWLSREGGWQKCIWPRQSGQSVSWVAPIPGLTLLVRGKGWDKVGGGGMREPPQGEVCRLQERWEVGGGGWDEPGLEPPTGGSAGWPVLVRSAQGS